MKVAIIHDWLYTYAGAEKVLEQLLALWPEADLFSLVDFLEPDQRSFLQGHQVKTSFVQRLPFARSKHRHYLPIMPLAVEQFQLNNYDLVVSSSYAVAKGGLVGPQTFHACYCHSPMRYAWDLQGQYLKESFLDKGPKSWLARILLHYLRAWDVASVNRVDTFIANSNFIRDRIRRCYSRDSEVVNPPVDISGFTLREAKENFYITASRVVQYKKMDLIVQAFSQMPDKQLIVIGDGPDLGKLRSIATPNITLMGYQPFEVLRDNLQRAKAFVFAAEEDFGIAPLEAQACGTPVLAFGRGGALETILGTDSTTPTGIFFPRQEPQSIIECINRFESTRESFSSIACRRNAERFSSEAFRSRLREIVSRDHQLFLERTSAFRRIA